MINTPILLPDEASAAPSNVIGHPVFEAAAPSSDPSHSSDPSDSSSSDQAPSTKHEAPSFLASVLASVQTKASLLADRNAAIDRATTAEARIVTLQADLATAQDQLSALNTQLSTLQSERAQIQAALDAANASAKTAEAHAAEIVASAGFPAEKLPDPAKQGDTREELEAQLAVETDNRRRWDIAARLNTLN